MLLLIVACVILAAVQAEQQIIGGEKTKIYDYPFMVAMEYDGQFLCGGSIISPNHIITAVQCINGLKSPIEKVKVRVGSSYLREGGEVHDIKSFVICELKGRCIVAILVLDKPITICPSAKPIDLVSTDQEPKQPGEMLTALGWGDTLEDDLLLSTTLKMVRLPFIERKNCSSVYPDTDITDKYICAGGVNKKSTYKGDCGGPLVNDKMQLVGVTNGSLSEYSPGYPGIFVNIANPEIQKCILLNTRYK